MRLALKAAFIGVLFSLYTDFRDYIPMWNAPDVYDRYLVARMVGAAAAGAVLFGLVGFAISRVTQRNGRR